MSASWATRIAIGMCVAAGACGQSAAVEAFEGVTAALSERRRQAHPLGQQRRRRAVRVDQSRQLAAGVDEQRAITISRCGSGSPRRDVGQQEAVVRQPGPVDQVGVVADGDVVAEPPRVLMGVGVAADPHDQGRVVDAVALGAGQTEPVGDPGARSAPSAACARPADPGRGRWPPTAPPAIPPGSGLGGPVAKPSADSALSPRLSQRDRSRRSPSRCRAMSNGSNRPCATTQMPRWGSRKSARFPCTGWGPTGPRSSPCTTRGRFGDRPHAFGCDAEFLAVGQGSGQPDLADAQQRANDAAHRRQRSAAGPRRGGQVAADDAHQPRRRGGLDVDSPIQQSLNGNQQRPRVIQVDSMSRTTGSTGVAELKYREQLCGPGVVA